MKFLPLILWILFSVTTNTFAETGKFSIEAIGGADEISIKRGSAKLSLKKQDFLQLNDIIETDSRTVVDIRYPDHSLIRVGVNSSFVIENKNPAQTQLLSDWSNKLLKGFIRVLVPESKQKTSMKIQVDTPAGTMGVRGTEFVVEHWEKKTQLYTLKGEVLMGPAKSLFSNSAEFVVVAKGTKSDVFEGGAPSKPVKFSIDEYIKKINNDSKGNPFHALSDRRSGGVGQTAQQAPLKIVRPSTAKFDQDMLQKKLLIKKDENVKGDANSKDKQVLNPNEEFFKAVLAGNVALMDKYAKEGAEVDFTLADSGDGPLHIVATNAKYAPAARKLLALGADINKQNNKGFTALMIRLELKDDAEAVQFFADNRANLKITNLEKQSAYDIALLHGQEDSAALLLKLMKSAD